VLSVDEVRRIVAYNRSVFDRFSRALQRRRWADVTRNRGIGHLSLKNTMVHILNVHEAWIVAIAQGRWEIFDAPGRRPEQVRSWTEFRRYEERVWGEVDAFVARLTPARLGRRVKAPWMPGRYTLADAFLQTTIEQAHHLGEIIGALWQKNWKPPAMTWIENQPRRRSR
jgi:uncharacterized damage-inducible protein DinB